MTHNQLAANLSQGPYSRWLLRPAPTLQIPSTAFVNSPGYRKVLVEKESDNQWVMLQCHMHDTLTRSAGFLNVRCLTVQPKFFLVYKVKTEPVPSVQQRGWATRPKGCEEASFPAVLGGRPQRPTPQGKEAEPSSPVMTRRLCSAAALAATDASNQISVLVLRSCF